MERRDLVAGTAAMMLTTALWATVYFVPALLPDLPTTAVAGGRFLALGLTSLAIGWRWRRRWNEIPWGHAFRFAVTGFVGYFLLLTLSVRIAGPTLTVVVMGAGPIVYSMIGARSAAQRRALVLPGMVVLTGIVLAEVAGATGIGGAGWGAALVGLVLTLGALASWISYGLANARLLASRPDLSAGRWTTAVGTATGVVSLPLVAFALATTGDVGMFTAPRTAGVLLALGIGPALVGSIGWNIASRRLSPSTAGQLIVLEPVFALTYAAIHLGHAPTGAALAGQVLLLAGAAWGVLASARADGAAAPDGAAGRRPRIGTLRLAAVARSAVGR